MDLNFNALGRDVSEAGCDARLLTGPLYIGSLGLHVEAIRVEKDVDFVQRAYHELHDNHEDCGCLIPNVWTDKADFVPASWEVAQ